MLADEEIIPELLQSKCNPKTIFETVDRLLGDKSNLEKQIIKSQEIINNFKTQKSSEIASSVFNSSFKNLAIVSIPLFLIFLSAMEL